MLIGTYALSSLKTKDFKISFQTSQHCLKHFCPIQSTTSLPELIIQLFLNWSVLEVYFCTWYNQPAYLFNRYYKISQLSLLRPHFFYFMVYGSADVVFWRNGKKIKFDFYTNFIIFFPPTLPRTSKTTSGQNKRIKLCYLCKKFRCVILFSTRRQTFVGALPIHALHTVCP